MIEFEEHIFQMGWNHQLGGDEDLNPDKLNKPGFHGM